jgi:hypothetical protein
MISFRSSKQVIQPDFVHFQPDPAQFLSTFLETLESCRLHLFHMDLTQFLELFEPVPAMLSTAEIDLSPPVALFIKAFLNKILFTHPFLDRFSLIFLLGMAITFSAPLAFRLFKGSNGK